ncbi:MAG: hypothetical protein KAR32_09885, partial [Candidatus Omnitrophica bacterium]|nr:hypothetical protein [Candidatus Omnitrophota bacterium]
MLSRIRWGIAHGLYNANVYGNPGCSVRVSWEMTSSMMKLEIINVKSSHEIKDNVVNLDGIPVSGIGGALDVMRMLFDSVYLIDVLEKGADETKLVLIYKRNSRLNLLSGIRRKIANRIAEAKDNIQLARFIKKIRKRQRISSVVRIGWRFLIRRKKDKIDALKSGINLTSSERGFYYILLEILNINANYSRYIGMEDIMWLFMQHMRTVDEIWDTFGRDFTLVDLKERLSKSYQSRSLSVLAELALLEKGVTSEQLNRVVLPMVPLSYTGDRLSLLRDNIDDMEKRINDLPMNNSNKAELKEVLIDAMRTFYTAYIVSKEIGMRPSFKENLKMFLSKGDFRPMAGLQNIFTSQNIKTSRLTKNKTFLYNFFLFIGVIDDLLDMRKDLDMQPNIILSMARQYYPNEYARLVRIINKGGIRCKLPVIVYAPRTLLRTIFFSLPYFIKMLAVKPVFVFSLIGSIGASAPYKLIESILNKKKKERIWNIKEKLAICGRSLTLSTKQYVYSHMQRLAETGFSDISKTPKFVIVGMRHEGEFRERDLLLQNNFLKLASSGQIVVGIEGVAKDVKERGLIKAYFGLERGLIYGIEDDFALYYTGILVSFSYFANNRADKYFDAKKQLIIGLRVSDYLRSAWDNLGKKKIP